MGGSILGRVEAHHLALVTESNLLAMLTNAHQPNELEAHLSFYYLVSHQILCRPPRCYRCNHGMEPSHTHWTVTTESTIQLRSLYERYKYIHNQDIEAIQIDS